MARQVSTAVSDLVLALTVFYVVYYTIWFNFFAAVGLLLQGAAASVGVYRFSQTFPLSKVVKAHKFMSWIATVAGMSLIASGFCRDSLPFLMNLNFMFFVVVLIVGQFLEHSQSVLATQACSGLAMLTVILASLQSWNVYGVVAACIYIFAGTQIGVDGFYAGIPRVDLLHYALVVGNIFFLWALRIV
ncbi:hypothetical protein LOTGIDRAFT_204307 [Lottia gigantea]|uniref:Uncharacterized protein n=1 Tax=Lottia gigantea TaxID=225164 RepID=V4BLU6_LOTGI|nr:hypothetical protein LOTGIDRAFT_204307 [Lottia gigantea]ESO89784.1 hypothetical protein LOTGIDRAFT_204307 [Lottia gigantea]